MIRGTGNPAADAKRPRNRLMDIREQPSVGLIPFINGGDPDLPTTRALLSVCRRSGVCAVELGVPFGDSVTDGAVVLRSHDRALRRKVAFEDVIELVRDLRRESDLPVILLVEYGHTVRDRGLAAVLQRAKSAGVDGMLMHCLPPLLLRTYLDAARDCGMATVLGLFPNSAPERIRFVLGETTGFIYLASTYGKTGTPTGLTPGALSFFQAIRRRTARPLAVGFGIKTRRDLDRIAGAGVDAGIVGSPVAAIVERHLGDPDAICGAVEQYFNQLQH